MNKIGLFFQQVRGELLHVKWPTRPDVQRLTIIVIATMIILGFYIGILDSLLTKLIELGIR